MTSKHRRQLNTDIPQNKACSDAFLLANIHGDLIGMDEMMDQSGRDAIWCEQMKRENRVHAALRAFEQQNLVCGPHGAFCRPE